MTTPPTGARTIPSLFLGSSTEGLPIARAVRLLLADAANITMWNEGFFSLGSTFIETLMNELPRFDFAVLILTPDDLVTSRDTELFGPRDNLIFELGLFTAGLGRSRTFIIRERQTKLPSDLAGVTTAGYQLPQEGQTMASALGPACDSMRLAITALGQSDTKTAQRITHIQARQTDIESTVKTLQIVVRGILTEWEYQKLHWGWGWSALALSAVLLVISIGMAVIFRLRIARPFLPATFAEFQKDREWLKHTTLNSK